MCTAGEIIDAIGRRRLAESLGVGRSAISNAAVDGKFPAKWFVVIRDLCFEVGCDCPLSLFNFVPSIEGQSEGRDETKQEDAA